LNAGVHVVCGTDDLHDPFVRFGDGTPLKALLLLVQITNQLHNAGLARPWSTRCSSAENR